MPELGDEGSPASAYATGSYVPPHPQPANSATKDGPAAASRCGGWARSAALRARRSLEEDGLQRAEQPERSESWRAGAHGQWVASKRREVGGKDVCDAVHAPSPTPPPPPLRAPPPALPTPRIGLFILLIKLFYSQF